ncbi:MAG TPA: TetR family transcriptional regulator [Dysgonamonadaceae bacterium]|jgi:AcrR family transcriptional regulator|nr:TetR/AcrR family transcriptional regulator [Clostridiaceae bacterium]HKM45855.1 TetR family transcriptional regulator [Dysgonamonadaceae bacterium]
MTNSSQNSSGNLSVKENIINSTIDLIQSSDGLVENITIRDISKNADISVGLINYHFGTKQKLIEICVQRIISQVMKSFSDLENENPQKHLHTDDFSEMTAFITRVFSFLTDHPEVSKISILGDLAQPNPKNNSSVSYKAIYKAIADTESENMRKLKAFMLLACIQSAFLNRHIIKELLDVDFVNEDDYYQFFYLVAKILDIL